MHFLRWITGITSKQPEAPAKPQTDLQKKVQNDAKKNDLERKIKQLEDKEKKFQAQYENTLLKIQNYREEGRQKQADKCLKEAKNIQNQIQAASFSRRAVQKTLGNIQQANMAIYAVDAISSAKAQLDQHQKIQAKLLDLMQENKLNQVQNKQIRQQMNLLNEDDEDDLEAQENILKDMQRLNARRNIQNAKNIPDKQNKVQLPSLKHKPLQQKDAIQQLLSQL